MIHSQILSRYYELLDSEYDIKCAFSYVLSIRIMFAVHYNISEQKIGEQIVHMVIWCCT